MYKVEWRQIQTHPVLVKLHGGALRRVRDLPDGETPPGVAAHQVLDPLAVAGKDEVLEGRWAVQRRPHQPGHQLAENQRFGRYVLCFLQNKGERDIGIGAPKEFGLLV